MYAAILNEKLLASHPRRKRDSRGASKQQDRAGKMQNGKVDAMAKVMENQAKMMDNQDKVRKFTIRIYFAEVNP